MLVTLYHGTSSSKRSSIEQLGLRPRTDDGNYGEDNQSHPYVYLTKYYPVYFSLNALKTPDEKPLLVRVEVDSVELLPDEDFLAQVAWRDPRKRKKYKGTFPGLSEMELLRKIGKALDPLDYFHMARHSLEYMGNVCIREVAPQRITGLVELPTTNIFELASIGADSNYTACTGPLAEIVGGMYLPRLELLFNHGWAALREDLQREAEEMREKFKLLGN